MKKVISILRKGGAVVFYIVAIIFTYIVGALFGKHVIAPIVKKIWGDDKD